MNRKIFLLPAIAVIIFLSSCLTGLHNLVDKTTITTDNRITGNWQYDELAVKIESVPQSLFFKHSTAMKLNNEEKNSGYDSKEDSLLYSKAYIISFARNSYQFYMVCCLTRLGNELYADIQPVTSEPLTRPTANDANDLFNDNYIPSHSIAKVVFRNNDIEFRLLNGDFIKDQLINGNAGIKYESDNLFGSMLVTSPSGDLRQFLSKYGNDERLYSPENTITLKKISL